jgi:hypothetical protein
MMVNPLEIPEVVIDENLFSQKLILALKKIGVKVRFLGRGILDEKIERYIETHNAVLVTGDHELYSILGWEKSLYLENWNSLRDKIIVIKAFLERFYK